MAPEKRPDRAIAIANQAGLPLRMAAKVDKADEAYFRERIVPLLDRPLITVVGEIGDAEKSEFLGNARALLFPIDWPERFGLVMIEAMACGTPVIAWPHGSVPEVVDEGVTGYVLDDVRSAALATRRVTGRDRARVRRVFEERFSATAMARAYLRIYERLDAGEASDAAPIRLHPQSGDERTPRRRLVAVDREMADVIAVDEARARRDGHPRRS
jgi:glycosyltransferase involved in cell wall biosynthesis